MWTINETTERDLIMIMHRLKCLIGSFYHRKRIDIIMANDANKESYYEANWLVIISGKLPK